MNLVWFCAGWPSSIRGLHRKPDTRGRFGFQYGSARLGFNILSVQATYETLLIKKIVLRPQAGDFTRVGRKGGNISMKSSFARRGRNYIW